MQDFRRLLRIFLAVLPLGVADHVHAQNTVATDKAALVALYNATDGANWTTNTNWTSDDEPLSSWSGVTTNGDGRVTALVLNDNGLDGTLPPPLGNLSELEQLDLRDNALSGVLPSELANLSNLTALLLNKSRALTGPLPDGLRELSDLETVNIEKTELCAPEDDPFQTWLATITFSGLICPPAEQSVIDVAVFYTSAAREEVGGIDEIETSIDLMVAETNTAYRNGGVNQRIKLVAVEEVVGYTQEVDTGSREAASIDLGRLQSPSDGYMDDVHDTRDAVATDIVLLVRSGYLNLANWMATPSQTFDSQAFGVVIPDNALTFAHELGHIMGLHHDRYVYCRDALCNVAPFPYAFGYVNQRAFDPNDPESPNPDPTVPTTARWRTIMSYFDQCYAAGNLSCPQLLRFSNPDQVHPDPGGDPLGKAGLEPSPAVDGPSDAVRMLNRTRGYVANFRSPPDITVSFGAEQYTATEGGAAATVTVRLSDAPGRAFAIPLTATGATGAAVEDYAVPRSVAFAADDTEQTFTVTAVDDGVDDDGETVALTLGYLLPGGVSAGSPATATVTLTDNDTVIGPPSVLSVSLTSDPGWAYARFDEIEATVRFDKTVTVTGTPQLKLTVGNVPRWALYQGGAREVLTFSYQVTKGENDANGVSIPANALILSGGTIRDSTNQDAGRTHSALADDANHRVDGVTPMLLEAMVDEAVLTLTYNEPLSQPLPRSHSAFSVVASSRPLPFRKAREVMVNGSIMTVILWDPVLAGEEVTVGFSNRSVFAPSLIRDLAGNAAAPLVDQEVTNVTEERVYDIDGDGLIEITTLAQLDAVRHDLAGDGVPTAAGATTYRAAFPNAFPETDSQLRCVVQCRGYELIADLDFFDINGDGQVDTNDDANGDGQVGADDTPSWNNGAGWNPIGNETTAFRATFEGNGHTVRNLFINRPTTRAVGLFGYTWPASAIRHVGVTQADVTGSVSVGVLVGRDEGTITASYATGRVSGVGNVGGLVGLKSGTITASYASIRVSGTFAEVGGLVGWTSGSIITGNYATGRVSGKQRVGGLVGNAAGTGTIAAGYSTGRVTGTSNVGGLAGAIDPDRLFYSYWDTLTSGQATSDHGTGQTTAQLQAPTGATGIYADWDDDEWDFGEADEYPVLVVDFDGDGVATWEEFGYQLREGPTLTATASGGQVVLEWTAVDATLWTPAPSVTYTLTRDDGTTSETLGEGLSGLTFTDTDVTADTTYTYQVAAVVTGGEATRSALVAATALPNMWLSPTASDPVAAVRSAAIYSVTFQGAWSTTVTPDGVPSGAHFTTLIGGVHNAGVTFLREGDMASAGVELMAELGGTSTLANEVRAAEPDALSVTQGSGGNIGPTGSSTISTVTLTTDHPRVTLLSMVAPSPDWFVGVSGLPLLDEQADWLASRTVNLYPWDAGTEEGTEFSLTNSATSPQETITSLRGMGKFSNEPIATLTFTRQSVNTAPSFTSDTSFEVDENQTAAATVAAEDPDSGDGVSYEITGGADALKFDIAETTGGLTFKVPPNYERAADVASTDPLNDAGNNEYVVTVTATGGTADRALTAEQTITVSVRNVDEAGTVSFSQVGAAIRAKLSDPDGGVNSRSWQWARSSDRSTGWTNIGGATSASYTPSSGDQGMYLRATVSYNDAQGSGKQAQGVSSSEIAPPDLQVDTLVSDLSIPWGIALAPDGTMLFTQRAGVLSSRLADGTVQTIEAEFGDLLASGETGLMGIVVDPSFASNRRFYTCQGHTGPEIQVIAWTINTAYTVATRVADPLVGGMPAASGRHGGCRLRFGPQGYLWIATGDAASGTVPQDLNSLGGKVLRVDASTGAGAPTNPFAPSRVYTYGHRNVQGLALRPGTSQMWSVEHGPSVDDEINLLAAGRNYGWDPVPGYNEGVSMTDLVKFPHALEAQWSSGSPTLATSGGIFLEGDQWGVWEGRLAVATLKDSKLRLFEFTPDGAFVSQVIVPELNGVFGRLRTPMLGPDGDLYVSTSNGGGRDRILRIAKDTTAPTVSMVEISSNPGPDGTYAIGEAIEVTVTFDETVVVTGRPWLSLTVGAETKPATYDRGSDSDTLVFAYPVASGNLDTDGVSIAAGRIERNGGTIKDGSENKAVLDHEAVAPQAGHKVDGVKPELLGAAVYGASLTLTYSEVLDGGSRPAAGDFTVSGGDSARTVSNVAVSGSTVELTLDPAAEHGETGITVSYTPGTNPIRDAVGNAAGALSREPVTNETPDTTSPTVSSLAITSNPGADQTYAMGDEIEATVTFSETVVVTRTPRMRLRVGSRNRTAGYLRGSGTAALVFGYEVALGDEDTDGVSIAAGRIDRNSGTIKDEADNDAVLDHEALAPQAGHKVDGVRPAFLSAAVDGSSLTLTYGEALDGGSRPGTGDFTVEVGGTGRSVSAVSVSGSVVTLTLDPAVEHGDMGIRVSYSPGTQPIRDAVGNDALGLSSQSVTNTTGAPNTAPEITSPGSFDVPENQALVRRLAARDDDPGDEVTGWEIVGGADRFQFSVAPDTGELSFRTAPDFEAPGDNEYEVTVEVRSGTGARELEAEQTFTVRVTDEREPPRIPEAPTFSGETAESMTVNWSEPENTGPPITDYDVQYQEGGSGGFTDAQHEGPGFALTLSDLKAGTVYEVQVRARNDEGMSDWSESGEGMTVTPLTVQMTPSPPPPVEAPFTMRFSFSETVVGFTRTDITTQQEPACTDSGNNPIFCNPTIAALQTTDDRIFTTTVTPRTAGVNHNYTLTIAVPADTVTSVVDNKPNEAEMLDARVAPPGVTVPISSLGRTASPGNGQVTLRWNTPQNTGGSAIIRYEYRWAEGGGEFGDWMRVDPSERSATVPNLTNGREYVFEVRGVNALGYGPVETASATPESGGGGGGGGGGGFPQPPRPPANNRPMADAGPDQTGVREGALVTLDGSGSSDPDDDPLKYRWNQYRGERVALSSRDVVNPTFTAPRELTADVVLSFRLLVTDPGGRFDTDTVEVTVTVTEEDNENPGKPLAPTVSAATPYSLMVEWMEPENSGPAITDYDVQYREGGSGDGFTDAQHQGTARTATLTGLSPDTVYEVQVRATNATGTGDWSEPGEGKTKTLQTGDQIYYFPHLAVGASWQTTITYINYSPQEVTCQTDFISDHGSPLMVSFAELGTVDSRTDVLLPGGSVHQETNVDLSAPLAPGWALANCSGPVKASLLYRQHNSEGVPTGEAAVSAAAVPATRFVTFAEQEEGQFGTGVAYANPSATAALVTFTARDTAGEVLASVDRTLLPGGHDAHGMGSLFGLTSFTGSIEVTSTEPIVSLSLNFEADPVFSSLPPGELDASAQGSTTYYFPHLAVGASWQTTITYINYSPEEVSCQTDFISDHGTPLMVSFAALGTVVSRTDVLPPGGSVHQETNVDLNASLAPGWARANCSGPVKASLLYRLHNSEGMPTAEAGVNATAVPATRFVTFAEQGEGQFGTGVAYANPSAISVPVTFTARDAVGEVLASVVRTLSPGGHDAHGMAELFGLTSFSGSIEVTSTEPIVSLSLNFEAAPVFSSLPPGEAPWAGTRGGGAAAQ